MAKVFMTIMGTGDYKECDYCLGEESYRSRFVQEAIIGMLTRQGMVFDKIVCFMTEQSKESNWKDCIRKDRETGEEQENKGLESILDNMVSKEKIEPLVIPFGSSEKELLEIFKTMYEAMGEEDELYIDVTHGFRSMPMLYFPVISYAKALKRIEVKAIYYGAFERDQVNTPIFDLSVYGEVMDWAVAAQVFAKYGNSEYISELTTKRKIAYAKKKDFSYANLHKVTQAMKALTDAIQTGRGKYVPEKSEKSIAAAYEYVNKVSAAAYKDIPFAPLEPLVAFMLASVKQFDTTGELAVGMATVDWCVQKGLVQQGYTALEETIKTFTCYLYGYKDMCEKKEIRENLVSRAITAGNIYAPRLYTEEKSKKDSMPAYQDWVDENREQIVMYVLSEDKHFTTEKESKENFLYIIRTIPLAILDLAQFVKEKRNDINHFGMRENPADSKDLKSKLQESYEKLKTLVSTMEEIQKEMPDIREALVFLKSSEEQKGTFVNCSNHPSANWGEQQRKDAEAYGNVIDVPFPTVGADCTREEVEHFIKETFDEIMEANPATVMCQGEFTVTYGLVSRLKRAGIKVVAACSERMVTEEVCPDGSIEKKAVFCYQGFREY